MIDCKWAFPPRIGSRETRFTSMGPQKVKLAWNTLTRLEPAAMPAPAALVPARVVEESPQAAEYYDNSVQREMKVKAARSWNR